MATPVSARLSSDQAAEVAAACLKMKQRFYILYTRYIYVYKCMYVCVLALSFLFTPDINFIADGSEAQKLDKSFAGF